MGACRVAEFCLVSVAMLYSVQLHPDITPISPAAGWGVEFAQSHSSLINLSRAYREIWVVVLLSICHEEMNACLYR